jgi:hypothetical protein
MIFPQVTNENATQCVVEFEQQYYDNDDLMLFFDEMGLPRYSAAHSITSLGSNFAFTGIIML